MTSWKKRSRYVTFNLGRLRIPTRDKNRVWGQLQYLRREWQNLQQSISRKPETEEEKRDASWIPFDTAINMSWLYAKQKRIGNFWEHGVRKDDVVPWQVMVSNLQSRKIALARSAACSCRARGSISCKHRSFSLLETSSVREPELLASAGPSKLERGTISLVTRDVAAALQITAKPASNLL